MRLKHLCGDKIAGALAPPAPIEAYANFLLDEIRRLAPPKHSLPRFGAPLLTERAALNGYRAQGSVSPNGSCRLLATCDGIIALNLARPDDWGMMQAWLEVENTVNDWTMVKRIVSARSARDLRDRGRDMGLAVSLERAPAIRVEDPKFHTSGRELRDTCSPLVLDFSSLWAGPLAGKLLGDLGCRVIKIESQSRPDGARLGNREFYARLNNAKECAAFDFNSLADLNGLRRLIDAADIVIEASRPRAFRALGIDWESRHSHGNYAKVWISMTAYGRTAPRGDWAGFGDDISVAAGASWMMRAAYGRSMFVGDALADPLTGLYASLCAWRAWTEHRGGLIDISMKNVVTRALNSNLDISDLNITHPDSDENINNVAVSDIFPTSALVRSPSCGAHTTTITHEFKLC